MPIQHILTLPVELLVSVLEQLLFAKRAPLTYWHSFGSFWNPHFKDSTLLLPVSQTCRRLREVALSRPDLWGHLSEVVGHIKRRRLLLSRPILDLFISRSKASPIVAVADPDQALADSDNFLGVFTSNSQIEEIHLLHTNQLLIDSLAGTLASAHPARLKVLTCAWRKGNGRCKDVVALDHRQLPVLRYLCLAAVPFRLLDPSLRQPFSSITNLMISRIRPPTTRSDIESLLRLCPSLTSIVLTLSCSFNPSIRATTPLPVPRSLRRLILEDMNTSSFGVFLPLFPPSHPIALQLLTALPEAIAPFQYKPVLKERLHGTLTHLRISVAPAGAMNAHMGHSYLLSTTFATDRSAVHVASVIDAHLRKRGADVWLSNLLSASGDALDFAGVREVWVTKLTDALTAGGDLGPLHADVMDALNRMPVLDTVVLVTVYRSPGYGAESVYTPDLSIVPGLRVTATPDDPTSPARLKTLRLVYCDASPRTGNTGGGANLRAQNQQRERVSFGRMLEQLEQLVASASVSESQATGGGVCPENLVVQLVPRFEIEQEREAVAQLRRHFRTVTVERIDEGERPRMPLPPCCVELDEGPGGSDTWRGQL